MPVVDNVCNFLLRVVNRIGKFGDYLMDVLRQLILRDYPENEPLLQEMANSTEMIALDLTRHLPGYGEMQEGLAQVRPPPDILLVPISTDSV